MRVIDAVERQPFSLSVAEVLRDGLSIDFLPQVRAKGYFDIDFRQDKLVLVAGNYVGQIPLTSDIVVNVRPKAPIANLARVIGVANQPIRCLDFFRRKYQLESEPSNSMQAAFARSLVSSLRELDREGVYREYCQRDLDLVGVRGRVDLAAYLRQSLPRGGYPRVRCRFFELSSDTLLNRVIKRAVRQVGEAMSADPAADRALLQDLGHYANMLDAVPLDLSRELVSQTKTYLERVRLPALRRYYLDIIDTCLLILQGDGIELIGEAEDQGMHSLIVNLEDAFELYLRAVLSRDVAMFGAGVTVHDGNKEGKSALFSDNKTYDAKPDFVIRSAAVLIGDAKYKAKPAESDRYQLISHACSYGAKRAFIVTPVMDTDGNAGGTYIGKIGVASPIEVFHYRFDLSAPDLQVAESDFVHWTVSLFAQ